MRLLKIPEDLLAPPYNNKALLLDGFSVVDSCFYTEKVEGRMFLEEHVLLYVVSGQARVCGQRDGNVEYESRTVGICHQHGASKASCGGKERN